MERLLRILCDLGVDSVDDGDLTPDRRLRAHLALDSTETVELESELRRQFGVVVDLWDDRDYTLAEIAALIDGATARRR